MSRILLAGLTDHESAAIEIMVGMHWRDWGSMSLKRSLSLTVPEQNPAARACKACVVDLFGFGMRRHAPEHESRLLDFLAGRSAVLLVWGNNGGGWLDTQLKLAPGQQLAWVTMPYTTVVMRDALKKIITAVELAPPVAPAAASLAPSAPVAPSKTSVLRPPPAEAFAPQVPPPAAAAPEPVVPAWRRAMAFADKLKTQPPPPPPAAPRVAAPVPPAMPPASVAPAAVPAAMPLPVAREQGESLSMAPPTVPMAADAVGISQGALTALLTVFPQLNAQPLIGLVGRIMAHEGPLLVKTGRDAAFITYVQHGWLASGLPVSALLKILNTPLVVESVTLTPLPVDQVEETVRQHFGGDFHRAQKPLDALFWELVASVLKEVKLTPQADLSFQLQCFPNFTVLPEVGPLDVQLAAICSRVPQSLVDLGRAFPKHEQDVYRFALLTILTGLAVVTRLPSAPAAPAPVVARPPAAPAQQVAQRRGFFKSLLDKLF